MAQQSRTEQWKWFALVEGVLVVVLVAGLAWILRPGGAPAPNVGQANTANDVTLTTVLPGGTQTFTLSELKRDLKTRTLTVQDYADYDGATKTYEGFDLKEVLAHAGLSESGGDVIRFEALDGYATPLPFAALKNAQPEGLIAFREVGQANDWELMKKGTTLVSPGPLYVVWGGTDASSREQARQRPWPYQLGTIRVIDFKQTYNLIYPEGVPETDAVYRGFQLFARGGYDSSTCVNCHALNGQGGTVGPELNIPKNVTEYRDDAFLTAWIKNSKSFRASSTMPAYEGVLTDAQIGDILAYLHWMKDHKAGQ